MSVHELLAETKQIALIWSTDDVLCVRGDLTVDQAWKVLQEVERRHDPENGVNYDTVSCIADELFGAKL